MKIRNIIAAIILSFCIAVPTGFAFQPTADTTAADYETASGLITKCSLSCSDSDGMLKIYAKTQASGIMDRIGFVNIIIQRSSDLKNWTDEKNIGDFLESNRKYYTLSHTETVSGGFYYRIVCTHYADGIPFMSSSAEIQTAGNTSKAVWIDEMPEITTATTEITSTTKSTIKSTTTSTVRYYTENIAPVTATETSPHTSQTSRTNISISAEKSVTERKNSSTTVTSTAISAEKVTEQKKSDNSPHTSSGLPISAFSASAIAVITAILSRKKSK